jgi:hypothetical protein
MRKIYYGFILIGVIVVTLVLVTSHIQISPNQTFAQQAPTDYFQWSCEKLRLETNRWIQAGYSSSMAPAQASSAAMAIALTNIMQLKGCPVN